MSVIKLYGCPNTRSLRAAWALEEAGAEYEYVPVDRKRSFNPVPCISRAIVMDAASPRPQGQGAGNAIRHGSNTS